VENDISELCARGVRCLAVARTDPLGEWTFLGLLTFLDPPRPDTLQTILDSKKYGVAVKMITGRFFCALSELLVAGQVIDLLTFCVLRDCVQATTC
jgi:H+-transporting ATPase